jgi:UDP-N-acetylmuramate dehydrogenase
MDIKHNISVLQYNTFGIDVKAKYFSEFTTEKELISLLETPEVKSNEQLVLGGGSNVLLTKNFNGIVLKNNIKGVEIVKEEEDLVYVKSGAGENWHEFVLYCINKNFGGVENLSLIPGSVGASPMQNIGAYGVEIKDVFYSLEAINKKTFKKEVFLDKDCEFGYRESVFKRKFKNKYIITSVTYKLTKNPIFNVSYGAIKQELDSLGINEMSVKAISQAVINIRERKLPNPKEIGNAGSFFKNPVVNSRVFSKLKIQFPNIANYPLEDGSVKLAAGWLIDSLGWKGKTFGNYGVHKNQALVLVNYGGANGNEIYNLSSKILKDVNAKFGIELEREVNIY